MSKRKKHQVRRKKPVAPVERDERVRLGAWSMAWSLAVILLFMVLWIVPMWVEGTQKQRVYNHYWRSFPPAVQKWARDYPPFLSNLSRVACLFTKSVPAWGDWYFQIRFKRRIEWVTLEESDYSTLEPFGHHTRLNLMLSKSLPGDDSVQRQAMAEFIADRYYELNPESPPIEAVRFVRVIHRSNATLAAEKGPWRKRPLEDYADRRIIVDSTHVLEP